MDEDTFNLEIRKFLKHFGVTAQREIERAVREGLESGALSGRSELTVRARLSFDGLPDEHEVEGRISLA